jgi:hypothetical protein
LVYLLQQIYAVIHLFEKNTLNNICPKYFFGHRSVKAALSHYLQVAKQTQGLYDKDNISGTTVGVFAGWSDPKSSGKSRKQQTKQKHRHLDASGFHGVLCLSPLNGWS